LDSGNTSDSGNAPESGSQPGSGTTLDSGGEAAAHVVRACDSLAPAGTWENITPPVVPLSGNAPCTFGGAFAMNPLDTSNLYVGSCNEGIWKTTDCGATWAKIDTGTNGGALDNGRQWTFLIDPVNPDILYTNSGYNEWIPSGNWANNGVSGAFKSVNGGVDWEVIWPPADGTLANVVTNNFAGQMVMDPNNREHILLSFHAQCAAPYNSACFAESNDAGMTWTLINGEAAWSGGEGQVIYFLDSSTTWLWGSQTDGLWRTADSGTTWTAITNSTAQGHASGQLYWAADGTFYLPVPAGVLRSPDGITWTLVPNSGDTMVGVTGNGTTMYASRGFPWDPSTMSYEPFWTSPENDGINWTQLQSPMLSNGGQLAYDMDHHLLYSSDEGAGVWRVVTGP
jgi:hypothetical protein